MYTYIYKDSPFGPLRIQSDGTAIFEVALLETGEPRDFVPDEGPDEVCLLCAAQLREYFAGERKTFTVPLKMHGTDFQVKIWKTLLQVPYGSTITYGDLAAFSGHPRAARAVGSAMRNNPLWILVPCHRVVSASGLGGYGGPDGTPLKKFLLTLEGALATE